MKLQEITAPSQEPLEKDELKLFMRLEKGYTDEDKLLDTMIKTARQKAETILNRKLVRQEWKYWLDEWPDKDYITLPHALSTDSTTPVIKYYMTQSTEKTFGHSTYWRCDSVSVPGRLHLRYGEDWPSESLRDFNPIYVHYQSGFGLMSTNVPENIRLWMMRRINDWYENRESWVVGQAVNAIPDRIDNLLSDDRIYHF